MRIASKINAALLGAFACGTLATFATLDSTIRPQFDAIEREHARTNHERVTQSFDAFTEKLTTATQDYSFWDETYAFVQGGNAEDFVKSNLEPEFKAVANLGINALVFLRADGAVQWGAAYDLETEEPIKGLVEDIANLGRRNAAQVSLPGEAPEALRGLVNTSHGLMLVAIAPALRSDHSGPAMGKVASAKILSLEAAKELTAVDFTLDLLDAGAAQVELPEAMELATFDDKIQTTSLVRDAYGAPLAILKANSPRDVSRAGATAIRSALLMMVLAGTAAIGVLWFFLRHAVVSRVESLRLHFATAGSSGNIARAPAGPVEDEIGDLTRSFNSMADQVNQLREALADSAYKSGLSEWAAGTLHNVRNGLVPVTAAAWQVEQLLDSAWVANVETAASEHADAGTPAERREKLNSFLVGSAARFANAAKRTAELTGKITGASRSVLDMVSEFERFAHRKTEIEVVDLLPLVTASAKSVLDGCTNGVELVLPRTSALAEGNGIILRQVIANIVANAVEATAGQPHRGRIEVRIVPPAADSGRVCIEVTDNGEGLAPDRLTAIFQRGVSTRHGRHGGLGLHWCANAVKVLGGSIRATSDGPGRGATFTIELPRHESLKSKEAA